jgi:hypothetical protein
MKQSTTIIFLLMFSSVSFGCDNCNVYLNLTPDDGKHKIGFFYRMRGMQGLYNGYGLQTMTKHAAHGNDPAFWGNHVQETFRTYELRAEFQLKNRWRTYFFMPFVQNSQYIEGTERYTVSGLSDPILMQGFQLIDPTRPPKNEQLTQRLEIGAGIKAPLGRIDLIVNNLRPNLDLQPGSGSWDILSFVKYTLQFENIGAVVNANYKWNGMNKENYRYGNVLNATLNAFYQIDLGSLTLVPMLNANGEFAAYDESFIQHEDTGGLAVFAGGGLQLFWKGISLFGEFQKAISNRMNGFSQLINKHKINVGLSYYF